MIESNNKGGFRGIGLVPFDPEAVISKLDIKLRTVILTGPPSVATYLQPYESPYPTNTIGNLG
jgi:hypothetical protein